MATTLLQNRFSVAYGRLCHFVAIRRDNPSILGAEDGVIRAAISLCGQATVPSVSAVIESAKNLFSLTFSLDEVNRSIDRLVTTGQAERLGEGVRLTAETVAEVEKCVARSAETERAVRAEWSYSLLSKKRIRSEDTDSIWSAVKDYLAKLFARHGLQTLELLAPEVVGENDSELPASEILDRILDARLQQFTKRQGRDIVRSFLTDRTALRNQYLTELLDGTFSFFALTADEQTRELLRKNLPPLKLLVDTNFVFGLLDLHSNAFVAVSKDVTAIIAEQKFPFQLYYHPLTADEFRSVLAFYKRKLTGGRWSPAISRALLNVGDLSGIERRFHEVNAEGQISVEDFFARYGNLERVLEAHGMKPFRNNYEPWLEDEETLDLISRYKRFIEPNEKPHNVLRHDMILWRTLRDIRRNDPGPFGSGAFFLTCDYSLWRFDHGTLSRGTTGTSVLPNVFLQLLRPFVPRTQNFDESFVATFALPEFRSINSRTEQAVSRVASVIRLYSDLPEDLAVKILSDEALIAKVAGVPEDDAVISELIESAIADEATRLKAETERLREELRQQADTTARDRELVAAVKMASMRLREVEKLREELAATRQDREEALRVTSLAITKSSEEADGHRSRAERLSEERDTARKVADLAVEQLRNERGRSTRLGRFIAAALQFTPVVLAIIVVTYAFGSQSRESLVFSIGSIIYLAFAMPLELLDWAGKRDQPWGGRIRALSAYALGVAAVWMRDPALRLTWFLAAGALATFVALISEVAPKRKSVDGGN
jgi:hypothetical protein